MYGASERASAQKDAYPLRDGIHHVQPRLLILLLIAADAARGHRDHKHECEEEEDREGLTEDGAGVEALLVKALVAPKVLDGPLILDAADDARLANNGLALSFANDGARDELARAVLYALEPLHARVVLVGGCLIDAKHLC